MTKRQIERLARTALRRAGHTERVYGGDGRIKAPGFSVHEATADEPQAHVHYLAPGASAADHLAKLEEYSAALTAAGVPNAITPNTHPYCNAVLNIGEVV